MHQAVQNEDPGNHRSSSNISIGGMLQVAQQQQWAMQRSPKQLFRQVLMRSFRSAKVDTTQMQLETGSL
jgi:hypothetical protein